MSQQNLIIGLVTGALRTEVETILQRADIAEYFTAIVTGDEVSLGKPDPKVIYWQSNYSIDNIPISIYNPHNV